MQTCHYPPCGQEIVREPGQPFCGPYCCNEHKFLHAEVLRAEQEYQQLQLFERETARSGVFPVKRCG